VNKADNRMWAVMTIACLISGMLSMLKRSLLMLCWTMKAAR
jgi:hypothetical protein